MASAIAGAAFSVVAKALAPLTDPVLEAWAASKDLGPNVEALKTELLCVKAVLEPSLGREIHNSALEELLRKLQDLAYDAEDVLDELDYFRIQDDHDGTLDAVDSHPKGCAHNLLHNARHTAKAVGKRIWLPACTSAVAAPGARLRARRTAISSSPDTNHGDGGEVNGCVSRLASAPRCSIRVVGKCLPCSSLPPVHDDEDDNDHSDDDEHEKEITKLEFNRVDVSKRIRIILEQLQPMCQKICMVLGALGSNSSRVTKMEQSYRPVTTSESTEPTLYGRDSLMNSVTSDITQGKYLANKLTVLPIVGPGGIGKTTFTQHVYQQVKSHFQVTIWICVSLNFNANRLAQEALKMIPKVDGEKENCSDQERIEQRLKKKPFLLVLDDMWTCHEDEWKTLLAPFRKGEEKGNMIIITTRLPDMAKMIKTVDHAIQLKRLGTEDFMHFFEACVFDGHQQRKWEDQELLAVGMKIVDKLKGNPLAAKTVGRLLRNLLTLEHWTRVLESKEWELETSEYDIMPALKVSYNYLPFHLQQCFSYCSLFPEDYEFDSKELIHFWIGLGILHPCNRRRKIEDVGQSCIDDLVNHGFFKKDERDNGCPYYIVHDLLHNLAVNISSYECVSISSSNVSSVQIPSSVRHLSVVVDGKDVEERTSFEYYKRELSSLSKRLKVENLRTLMLFGQCHGSLTKTFGDLFEKARALRTVYLSQAASIVDNILLDFTKLIHLRYLRIESDWYVENKSLLRFLSKLYHLEVINLQRSEGCFVSTRDIGNLVKLRHCLVPENKLQLHSEIIEAGKLKLLMELRSFEVGKESKGFELSQLGQLSGLGGSLGICNLERIEATKEAYESEMMKKTNLQKLSLEWDAKRPNKDPIHEENVLEIMKPHSNIRDICIRGHGGSNCPKWLSDNLSVKNLESLHLDDVSWKKFPPLGEIWVVNEHGEEHLGCIPHNNFQNLRRLEFNKLPRLKKWAENNPCNLFSHLEVLIITHCFDLTELSFSHSTCCQQHKEAKINWFPGLKDLKIEDCPKLLSFPPVPWTRALCSAEIKGVGSGLKKLVCKEYYKSYRLQIETKDALVSELWNLLSFDNLTELKVLEMDTCPPLPQHHFQMLSSLETLRLYGGSSIVFPSVEGESNANYQSSVECIFVGGWDASAKELTQLLTYFPKLSELNVRSCEKITELAVVENQAIETPAPAYSDNKIDQDAEMKQHQQQDETTRGEEEIGASSSEVLLLLPSQLQQLRIIGCPELGLRSSPIHDNRESGRTGGGQGLQGLFSLLSLEILNCPRFLSSYSSSSSSSCPPFPTSLERLSLWGAVGTATRLPLSNLDSLTDLGCEDLRVEGLRHLLAQGRLTKLDVRRTSNFWAGPEPPLPHEQEFPSSSSKLQELETDDVAGVLAPPVCTLLSSSLTELVFSGDKEVVRFTEEQEEALQLLTSLEVIRFWFCDKLQCLPAGLHELPNLKRLSIWKCPAIRSLPKEGLPSSLQELDIDGCPAIQSLPKDCLPTSLQKLEIQRCPAIRSLPKDCLPSSLQKLKIKSCPAIRSLPKVNDLPSSLLELNVRYSQSEELRRQCRKLIGIIPVVYT